MAPPKLPVVSGRELVKFFEKHGFEEVRQRGSHIIMRKAGVTTRPPVIPNHREISPDIILSNLRTAGISRKDFVDAMQKRKK